MEKQLQCFETNVPKPGSDSGTLEGSNSNMEGEKELEVILATSSVRCLTKKEKKKLLKEVLKEEAGLKRTLEGLEGHALFTLGEVNKLIVGKQDEIDRLQDRVRGLKEGGLGLSLAMTGASPKKKEGGDLGGVNENRKGRRSAEVIFPEEIWEMILHNLRDPVDLRNASNACPLFSKILHPLKTELLFPLVSPQLFPYLDNEMILNCRQVCKVWNAEVDRHLEDHPSLRPFNEERYNPQKPALRARPLMPRRGRESHIFSNFRADLRTGNFQEKMRDHPGNPFVGRAVSIHILQLQMHPLPLHGGPLPPLDLLGVRDLFPEELQGGPRPPQEEPFYNQLSNFLKRFGTHIWYLHFELRRNRRPRGTSEDTLFHFLTREIFLHAPNLRRLRIGADTAAPWFDVDVDTLPDAPQLESLHISRVKHFHGLGLVVDTLVRKYHRQLKSLHVRMETLKSFHYFRNGTDLSWDNLVELHIDRVGGDLDIKPITYMYLPQLRKLVLTPGARVERDGVTTNEYNFETIMDIVINLSSTSPLLNVLGIFDGFGAGQIASAPGNLFAPPSLTTLEVEHYDWHADYSFLIRFPFLQNLIVFWPEASLYHREGYEMTFRRVPVMTPGRCACPGCGDGNWEEGLMKLAGFMYQKRVYECQIWELLPRLKVLTFQEDVYTRAGYEQFLEQKEKNEVKRSEECNQSN